MHILGVVGLRCDNERRQKAQQAHPALFHTASTRAQMHHFLTLRSPFVVRLGSSDAGSDSEEMSSTFDFLSVDCALAAAVAPVVSAVLPLVIGGCSCTQFVCMFNVLRTCMFDTETGSTNSGPTVAYAILLLYHCINTHTKWLNCHCLFVASALKRELSCPMQAVLPNNDASLMPIFVEAKHAMRCKQRSTAECVHC